MAEYIRMGKRGTVVVPAELRKRYGLAEGDMLVMEESAGGLLIKPVVALEVEVYSPARTAEFLINNALTGAEYDAALREATEMGIDPATLRIAPRPEA